MNSFTAAVLGVACLLVAGFIRGGASSSADPELVYAGTYALGGLGLVGVLAAGVALGIRLARR